MAHLQQISFCLGVKTRFPDYFKQSLVLDVGSFDVNGNNQYLFESCGYIGVDLMPGKNVDIIASGHALNLPDNTFDVIISTECAEHDLHYKDTLKNITRMLKSGGLFVFTCATTGRPEHGTRRTTPQDAPPLSHLGDWADYYQNIDENDFRSAIDMDAVFASYEFSVGHETHDLYFWGIKKGPRERRIDYSFQVQLQQTLQSQHNTLSKQIAEAEARLIKLELSKDMRILSQQNLLEEFRGHVTKLEHQIVTLENRNERRLSRRVKMLLRKIRSAVTGKKIKKSLSFLNNLPPLGGNLNLYMHNHIYILTPKHCIFIAKLIQDTLNTVGVKALIIHQEPQNGFADVPHFVIAPQIFKKLPGLYIAFQVEQSVSPRWFTKDYFKTLEHSFAILDYSITNLKYLQANGLSPRQMFFMPLSPLSGFRAAEQDDHQGCDVLFYGDPNCSRRQTILGELKKHFNVEVVSEVFGADLYPKIAKAKIVVNIHYYEGALLETTRIYECLSLGKLVVSEKSADQSAHSNLEGIVEFVDIGDISQMIAKISDLLSNDENRRARLQVIQSFVAEAPKNFQFHFMRFLLAFDLISFDQFYAMVGDHVRFKSDKICLGLPEYMDRQDEFSKDNTFGFEMFTGLRHSKSWVGCGLSYKFILKKAQEQGFKNITICEDDVQFLPGWEARYQNVLSFLDRNPDWDLFAGLISDLHKDANIRNIIQEDGDIFVYMDKMVSMVFNIYNQRFYQILMNWNPNDRDVNTNTIDRYIEANAALKVVTTHPFLVGHKEELHSTIWEFGNTSYTKMIQDSIKRLDKKIKEGRVQI